MEVNKFQEIYRIEEKRLRSYYDRIKNQFQNIDPIQTTAKFLNNQSIGTNLDEISEFLSYYKDKLREDVKLLDFALEWIRANQVRLEYKNYLIRTPYPNNDLGLAIDDCISTFYLDYDKYIRNFFIPFIQEHEISALYDVFFSPYDKKEIQLELLLETYKDKVPTIFEEKEKLNSSIITLRTGLSKIIVKDYESVLISRKESNNINYQTRIVSATSKTTTTYTTSTSPPEAKEVNFDGTRLARLVRACCFSKREIPEREFENLVSHFLASYFNVGKFYKFSDFKDNLINKLVEIVLIGITDKFLNPTPEIFIKNLLLKAIYDFREFNKIEEIDGLSWKNDLKPVLTKSILSFVKNWLNTEECELPVEEHALQIETTEIVLPDIQGNIEEIDFEATIDLNLSVETFRETLEKLLENSDMSLIEKRNFLRTKVFEFQQGKRKGLKQFL